MKAIVCTRYGPAEALELRDVAEPVPGPDDVLIRVCASTVTMGDVELRTLTLPLWTRIPMRLFMGWKKPRKLITGMELAGVVAAVGRNVTTFKEGDRVFGSSGMSMGANAEYKCRPARGLAVMPPELTFEEAATIPVGGINALQFLRRASIAPGQTVLVIGGGGAIGSYAVQLARFYGAEVTTVDHGDKLNRLTTIGAHHVIDYTREDFSENGIQYDVIFDTVYRSSFTKCVRSLKPDGMYLMANTGPRRMLRACWLSATSRKKTSFAFAAETPEDLRYVANLVASRKIKPLIDKIYPLEKVPEAHSYVESGRKTGCVVIEHLGEGLHSRWSIVDGPWSMVHSPW